MSGTKLAYLLKKFPRLSETFVQEFCGGELEFEPGTDFRFSNSNYVVLGAVVERITGSSFASVLEERITGLLDLDDTGVDDEFDLLDKRAACRFSREYKRKAPQTALRSLLLFAGVSGVILPPDLPAASTTLRSTRYPILGAGRTGTGIR